MSKKFLFPMKALPPSVNEVLKGLATADMVICYSMIMAVTDDDTVAALLDKLEASERILLAAEVPMSAAKDIDVSIPIDDQPKVRKPKRVMPPVPESAKLECSACHRYVASYQMTKLGICKVCRMQQKKAEKKLPYSKTMLETWTNRKPEFGHEESLAEKQARPKEKINLDKLSGKRLG